MKNIILKVIKYINLAILISAIALLVLWLVETAISKQEVVDCYKLERQSTEYEGFYLTKWQDEMCKAHGFNINARIER